MAEKVGTLIQIISDVSLMNELRHGMCTLQYVSTPMVVAEYERIFSKCRNKITYEKRPTSGYHNIPEQKSNII